MSLGTGTTERTTDEVMYEVEIPPFFCPIEPVEHPETELVHRRSGEWARSVGLARDRVELDRWLGTTSADFYGGMVPDAVTEHFQIAANWVYWGFSFDDAHCDEAPGTSSASGFTAMTARMLRILDSGDERLCGGDPHLLGLCDLARSYRRLATPTQVERWITAHRRWLFGVMQRYADRATGGSLSADSYLVARLHDCGGPPTQSMFEFANNAEIPGNELHSPAIRTLTELFWMVAALDNERVSQYKETLAGQDTCDLAQVLRSRSGLSEQQALDTAIRYRDRMMVLFLRLREQQLPTASAPLRRYLETLCHGIRSNIDWSLRTPRYTTVYAEDGRTKIGDIRVRGSCTDTPSDSRLEPLPLPSFTWWWEQLR